MINKFLEMLGVEMEEEFNIRYTESSPPFTYNPFHFEIEDGSLHLVDRDGDAADDCVIHIISGSIKIEKLPWKPKRGEWYYYVDGNNEVYSTTFSPYAVEDLYRFKSRNYFKTREEVEKHRDDFIKQFDKIREEVEK